MPIYEYECQECGLRFEKRQGINEPELKECPECHGPLRRLLHPVGIIFKGSGFYSTDYRPKKSSSEDKGEEK